MKCDLKKMEKSDEDFVIYIMMKSYCKLFFPQWFNLVTPTKPGLLFTYQALKTPTKPFEHRPNRWYTDQTRVINVSTFAFLLFILLGFFVFCYNWKWIQLEIIVKL